jgi:hypothetical protein
MPSRRKPRKFKWCVNRFDEETGRVWAVIVGRKWYIGSSVRCDVRTQSRFRGNSASQPKGYVEGTGVVRQRGDIIEITGS